MFHMKTTDFLILTCSKSPGILGLTFLTLLRDSRHFQRKFGFLLRIFLTFTNFFAEKNIISSKTTRRNTFMEEILLNLPHFIKSSSEPGSSVPYIFWTLINRYFM